MLSCWQVIGNTKHKCFAMLRSMKAEEEAGYVKNMPFSSHQGYPTAMKSTYQLYRSIIAGGAEFLSHCTTAAVL